MNLSFAASGSSGISLALTGQNLESLSDGGGVLQGTAVFSFPQASSTQCPSSITSPISSPLPTSASTDSLVFPVDALSALIHCSFWNGSLNTLLPSTDFPAWKNLMNSWFELLFVWPDLMNFSSSSTFYFGLYPTADPAIGTISSNPAGNLTFSMSAPLTVSVFAPINHLEQHYVDLNTAVSGNATLSIANGQLTYEQNTPSLNINAVWDELYVKEHQPDTYIWTSEIASTIKSQLASPGISMTLPQWQTPGAFSLSVQNAALEGTDVRLGLDVQSLK
jgi:hypothetical protein